MINKQNDHRSAANPRDQRRGQNRPRLAERFQDNDKDIPTILTSSQMLTTGVDARNVRNIVLDRNIGSMVDSSKSLAAGTRVFEGKTLHYYRFPWGIQSILRSRMGWPN